MRKSLRFHVLVCILGLVPVGAWADLYKAAQAAEKQELPVAFELYRELAELGQPEAQENLAVMYVNGEGVKRDNVLGYAWARIALAQGPRDAAQGIVDQLESHLTDAAKVRVADLQAKFGHEALLKSLLPLPREETDVSTYIGPDCPMLTPGNPDEFYPTEARNRDISGYVLMEYQVFGDGRVHDPRALYSIPSQVFDVAGRNVSLGNTHKPKVVSGVPAPCNVRIMVKFAVISGPLSESKGEADELTQKATAGDPGAQLLRGLRLEARTRPDPNADLPVWWYLKAAQGGLALAQFMLGTSIMNGASVQQDQAKAVLWLTKAANGGYADAQFSLANYYLGDMMDAARVATALSWLEKAVASGSRKAGFYLAAILATSPDAARRDSKRALVLIDQAMEEFQRNPIAFEIRAAARAGDGDFAGAQKDQARALSLAKRMKWKTAPQEARLAVYEANQSWTGDLFAFY